MKLSGPRAYISPTPVPKMPAGLVELMEGLTKDVLRRNPTDVFEFCAEHLKKLLELRDGRPPDRYLTLEKKIIKANNIIRERAKQRREKYDKEMQLNLRQEDSLSAQAQHASEKKEFDSKWEHDLIAQSLLKLEGVSKVIKNDNVNNFDLNNTESGNCNLDKGIEIYPKDIKDEDTVEKLSNIEQVSENTTNNHSYQKLKPNFDVNNCTLDIGKHCIYKSDKEDTGTHAENMVYDTKYVDKIENTESLSVTNIYNIERDNGESEKTETLVTNYSNDKPVLTNNENVVIPADTNINQNVEENLKAVNNIHVDESISDIETKGINLVEINIEKSAVSSTEVCQEIMKGYEDDRDNHTEQINYDQNAIVENNIFEIDYTNKDTDIITDNKESTAHVCGELNKDEYNYQFNEGKLSSDTGEVEIMDSKCLQKETFGKEYKDVIGTGSHDVIFISEENIEIKSVNTPTNYAEIEIKPVINDDQSSPESIININENHTDIENANGSENENKSESESLKINSKGLLNTSTVASDANETKVEMVNKLSPQNNDQNEDNATSNKFVEINTNEDSTQSLSKTYLREEGNNNSTENPEIKVGVSTDNPLLCEQNNSSIITNKDTDIVTDSKESTVCDEVNKDEYNYQFNEGKLSSETGEVEIMDSKCILKESFVKKEYKDAIGTGSHDVICISEENIDIKSVNTPTNYAEIEIKPVINNQFSPQSKINMNENHTDVENANGSENENKSVSEALKINSECLLNTSIVANYDNETKVEIVNKLSSQNNDRNKDDATSNNFIEISTNEDSTQSLSNTYLREEGNNSTENCDIKVIKVDVSTDNPLLCEQNNSSIIQNSDCDINDNSNKEILPNNTCVIEGSESKSTKAMDLETAAITIQKVFRNFLFRSKTSSFDESTNIDFNGYQHENNSKNEELTVKNQNINKDRRTLGISRMDTVLQTVNEEKSLSVSTDDSSTLSSAATVIQAHIRGFLVRNRLNRNKTISNATLVDSDDPSMSLETDPDPTRNKTVLNIHIVPDGSQFMSRDESLLTSVELSLDGSPPTSTNLHPLGYDKNERRKQLKREDAIQSISPPSNSCSRLSVELDSAKELFVNDSSMETEQKITDKITIDSDMVVGDNSSDILLKESTVEEQYQDQSLTLTSDFKHQAKTEISSDESDVITPFVPTEENNGDSDNSKLIHSGEFHDLVLPTKVSRSDTSVVRGE